MKTIVVEIPYLSKDKINIWRARNDDDIIERAKSISGEHYKYKNHTLETARAAYGKDCIPKCFLDLIEKHGEAVEVNDFIEHYAPDDAPTEVEHAKNLINRRFYAALFFTENEAKIFANKYLNENKADKANETYPFKKYSAAAKAIAAKAIDEFFKQKGLKQ